MISEDVLSSRMVLPDRIALTVSPDWYSIENDDNFFKDGYAFAKEKNFRVRRIGGVPKIKVPVDFKYVSDCVVSLKKPYAVSFEFNFIRFLKYYLWNSQGLLYNHNYDNKIRLNDDNYINSRICEFEGTGVYDRLIMDVPELCVNVAHSAFGQLMGDSPLLYSNVTIKQIEFNIDFFVGENNSLDVIRRFQRFLASDDGEFWIEHDMKSIARKSFIPGEFSKDDKQIQGEVSSLDGVLSHSYQFQVCRGCYFKIYRKTTDHVRAELTFHANYLKWKYSACSWFRLYDRLYARAKDFFKKVAFIEVLKDLSHSPSYTRLFQERSEKAYAFMDAVKLGLGEVYDAVLFGDVVGSCEGIRALRCFPDIRKDFVRELSNSGRAVYRYDPVIASAFREKRVLDKKVLEKF